MVADGESPPFACNVERSVVLRWATGLRGLNVGVRAATTVHRRCSILSYNSVAAVGIPLSRA